MTHAAKFLNEPEKAILSLPDKIECVVPKKCFILEYSGSREM